MAFTITVIVGFSIVLAIAGFVNHQLSKTNGKYEYEDVDGVETVRDKNPNS